VNETAELLALTAISLAAIALADRGRSTTVIAGSIRRGRDDRDRM
jgi:hypothetical protein